MDLGGRYAGTLSGFMNMCGMVGGLLAPWTIPMILEAAGNDWERPILVIAASYFVGALAWFGIDPVTPIAPDPAWGAAAGQPVEDGARG
jgi:ACS family glucarate transporter-like MFS transporter